MKKDEKFELLLNQINELTQEMKQVRQMDIPGLHTRIALSDEKLSNLKEDVKKEAGTASTWNTIIGSGLAVLISAVLTFLKK